MGLHKILSYFSMSSILWEIIYSALKANISNKDMANMSIVKMNGYLENFLKDLCSNKA